MTKIYGLKKDVYDVFFGNFPNLTEIQQKSIPLILEGKNIIISSGTGTGKTEAVIAPLISRYLDYALSNNYLTWLYLTPTKALANDIYKRLEPILSKLYINISIKHSDKDKTKNKKNQHFLVTTIESLDVILCRADKMLKNLKAVIIDEVHILYNSQRGLHASLLLSRLKKEIIEPQLQIACLSATISSCDNIVDFLFGESENFVKIEISSTKQIDPYIIMLNTEHKIIELTKKITKDRTVKLLLFSNNRKKCDYISTTLSQIPELSRFIFTHYSSISALIREEVEKAFNESKMGICVATSTLELGIDIGDIDAVVLYDVPATISSFLQRIGRGNRRDNKNNVICLVPEDADIPIFRMLSFYAIIDLAKNNIVENTSPMKLYGAMAQQILSIIASKKGAYTKVREIVDIATQHQKHLTEEVIEEILISTSQLGFTRPHDFKHSYGAGEKLYLLMDYRILYGNMPIKEEEIVILHEKKEIGNVPKFNLLYISDGDIILFAGKCWKVIQISDGFIKVEPYQYYKDATEIKYDNEKLQIDPIILNRIHAYLTGTYELNLNLFEKSLREAISNVIKKSFSLFNNTIPVVRLKNGFYHVTLAGELCNQVISKFYNSIQRVDNIGFFSEFIIDFSTLSTQLTDYIDIVNTINSFTLSQTIFQMMIPDNLKRKELLENWLNNKEIENTLKRLKTSTTKLVTLEDIEWLIYKIYK